MRRARNSHLLGDLFVAMRAVSVFPVAGRLRAELSTGLHRGRGHTGEHTARIGMHSLLYFRLAGHVAVI